ncbi:YpiF family protein [Bacillus timonensis]|nr:YpiF family protein [Bacillus timonensis]
MKWITKDVDIYLQSKEYVDTAIIPLIPVSWTDNMKSTVAMGEFISILANEVDRQFKGRILLIPSFTYLISESEDSRISRLCGWEDDLKQKDFKHVIYLTSDSEWKNNESQLNGTLIWMPTLPLEYVEEKYKQTMIHDQMKQLISIFMNIWQK